MADTDSHERSLAQWLSLQRRAYKSGTLREDRQRILAALPGWDRNPRAEMEAERWVARLEELREFCAAEGRWPRYRESADETERVLGGWLHRQRQAFGACLLAPTELRLLDSGVPGWNEWRLKHLAKLATRA